MESMDQMQDSDDEKLSKTIVNDIGDDNLTSEVLAVKSEESIFLETSEKIQKLMKTNEIKSDKEDIVLNCSVQEELKKQVSTGEITPFQAIEKQSESTKTQGVFNKTSHLLDLEKYLRQQAELAKQRKQSKDVSKALKKNCNKIIPQKKTRLSNTHIKQFKTDKVKAKQKSSKRKLISSCEKEKTLNENSSDNCTIENLEINQIDKSTKKIKHTRSVRNSYGDTKDNADKISGESASRTCIKVNSDSGSEYVPSDEQIDSDNENPPSKKKKYFTKSVQAKRVLDDGDEKLYMKRVQKSGYSKNESLHEVDNLFKVPQCIWKRLYKYQKVSIQWLWELHSRALGGLLGDEMGLGKTVQVIAFLAGLDSSELLSDGGRFRGLGPTIIICPATLMEQWVKHFHDWWPILRVVVLHQSGTYSGDLEYLMDSLKSGGILITSYSGMLNHKDLLVSSQWHYVILDEGHKIRNPQAKISKAVKEFSTPHRLLLTGSPMQNSLKELWSLFDFILPGKLGTLAAFLEHCAIPITRGGYTNASPLQEATALQVATMLRDAITPYMLRRTKNDVQHHIKLPEKNEQVLFCSLTEEQKKLYKKYLRSEDVIFVLHEKNHAEVGRYKARLLIALSALRKICNHPDLYLYANTTDSDEEIDLSEKSLEKFGFWKRSGKMIVVRSLLKIWKKQGHRVLLFTQGRQMMHILESLVQNEEYTYLRMDGTTPMSQRQETIRLFNNNSSYFIFLLTTRVGGLGVNLTGADRVIIYDPDWNPATDAQARERAWRIGQDKKVTIYRLITAGTIEEKIYHRQIFKVLLSNKVLEDPRQRRLFKTTDLVELFNLNESINGHSSESDQLFKESRLIPRIFKFSCNEIEKMRSLASTLSKNIGQCSSSKHSTYELRSNMENNNFNHENNNDQDSDVLKNSNPMTEDNMSEQNTQTKNHENDINVNTVSSKEETNNKTFIEEKDKDTKDQLISVQGTMNKTEDKDQASNNTIINIEAAKGSNKIDVQHALQETSDNCKGVTQSNAKKNKSSKLSKTHHKHKRNKEATKTDKNNISALFDGERISHLIGRRFGYFQTNDSKSTADDQYVLEKLFAKANVTSAFQHDTVLSGSKYNLDETNPMQRLARETAQENMENIRKSRKWCWKPTWDSQSLKND